MNYYNFLNLDSQDNDVVKIGTLDPSNVALSSIDNDILLRVVDEKETKKILGSMSSDKARSPNRFLLQTF